MRDKSTASETGILTLDVGPQYFELYLKTSFRSKNLFQKEHPKFSEWTCNDLNLL